MSVNEKMTAIADNIRSKTGGTEALNLDDMASGVEEVYDAGFNEGDYNARLAVTKNISRSGKRTSYARAFQSTDWSNFNFIEGYIKPTSGIEMFYSYSGAELPNGIDLSNVTSAAYCFCWASNLKVVPDLGIPAKASLSRFVQHCYALETIAILRISEETDIENPFQNCNALKNITIEGEICKTVSFSESPLTVGSLKSIITHLKDYAGTSSEYKYTVAFASTAFSVLAAEGATSPNGNTWAEYIDDLKWNLTLA